MTAASRKTCPECVTAAAGASVHLSKRVPQNCFSSSDQLSATPRPPCWRIGVAQLLTRLTAVLLSISARLDCRHCVALCSCNFCCCCWFLYLEIYYCKVRHFVTGSVISLALLAWLIPRFPPMSIAAKWSLNLSPSNQRDWPRLS